MCVMLSVCVCVYVDVSTSRVGKQCICNFIERYTSNHLTSLKRY